MATRYQNTVYRCSLWKKESVYEMNKFSHHRKNNKLNGKQISSLIVYLICFYHSIHTYGFRITPKQIIIWEKEFYYLEQLLASGELSMDFPKHSIRYLSEVQQCMQNILPFAFAFFSSVFYWYMCYTFMYIDRLYHVGITETVFSNFLGAPESIPWFLGSSNVWKFGLWRAGTTTLFLLGS